VGWRGIFPSPPSSGSPFSLPPVSPLDRFAFMDFLVLGRVPSGGACRGVLFDWAQVLCGSTDKCRLAFFSDKGFLFSDLMPPGPSSLFFLALREWWK